MLQSGGNRKDRERNGKVGLSSLYIYERIFGIFEVRKVHDYYLDSPGLFSIEYYSRTGLLGL
jgi:hypothetical protein